jgi:hypothetical protein
MFEHTYWFLKRHCVLHFTSWYDDDMNSHEDLLFKILLIVTVIVNAILVVTLHVSRFSELCLYPDIHRCRANYIGQIRTTYGHTVSQAQHS